MPNPAKIEPRSEAGKVGSILAGYGIAAQKKNGNSSSGGLSEEKLLKILATLNNNEQVIRVQTPIHIVGGELVKKEKTTENNS